MWISSETVCQLSLRIHKASVTSSAYQIAACPFVCLNVDSLHHLTKAFWEGESWRNCRPLIYTTGVPRCHTGLVGPRCAMSRDFIYHCKKTVVLVTWSWKMNIGAWVPLLFNYCSYVQGLYKCVKSLKVLGFQCCSFKVWNMLANACKYL